MRPCCLAPCRTHMRPRDVKPRRAAHGRTWPLGPGGWATWEARGSSVPSLCSPWSQRLKDGICAYESYISIPYVTSSPVQEAIDTPLCAGLDGIAQEARCDDGLGSGQHHSSGSRRSTAHAIAKGPLGITGCEKNRCFDGVMMAATCMRG